MINDYKDIIDLPHYKSNKRPHMSAINRAAQFAPFAALTGHDEAVKETARLTDRKIELSEDAKIKLDDKLQIIRCNLHKQPMVAITYFQADKKKAGGSYIEHTGIVKKIDDFEQELIFADKVAIPFEDILLIKAAGGINEIF